LPNQNFRVKNGLEVGTGATISSGGNITAGIISATSFVGSGSQLTGVVASSGIASYSNVSGVSSSVVGGAVSATSLTVTGVSTFEGAISVRNGYNLNIGDNNDLRIYNDGTDSKIEETGSGSLYISGSDINIQQHSTNKNFAKFISGGAVELYYNDSKKFETTGTGVTITGTLFTNQLSVSGVSTISVNSSTTALRITQTGSGNAFVVEDETTPDATPFVVNSNGNVGLGTSTATAILDIRGNPWFSPNITGVKATALRLGRFVDGVNAAYDIITDDNTGDDIEIQSNRYTGRINFSRASPSGIQTTFQIYSHYQTGSYISISNITGTATKIQIDEANNTFFNNSGAVLVGTISSTGTTNQKLQVTGDAYFSGNLGIGSTNPTSKLSVVGVVSATSFYGDISNAVSGRWILGADGTSNYTFTGIGFTQTANDPTLYLKRGEVYEFVNNSGGSHPFQIRVSNGGAAYDNGVTNNGSSTGTIRFEVPYNAPNTLYYQCTNHSSMGGTITVLGGGGGLTAISWINSL